MSWSPSTSVPFSSTITTRSASPSSAMPISARTSCTFLDRPQRMRRAAVVVDVEAVRLVADGDDLGAELPQRLRRDLVAGAVGAIDDDAQPRQRHRARQRALGEFDVAVVHAVDALGAAERILVGQRDLDVLVEQRLDARLDLVGKLVAVGPEQLDAVVVVGIVRGRDHHAEIGAQRARQHRHGGRRDRAEQEHIHAGRAEAGDQRVLEHVAGKPRILADHDPVAVIAALERQAGGHADLHRQIRRHRKLVGPPANAVSSKILPRHRTQIPRHTAVPRHRIAIIRSLRRASHCVSPCYERLAIVEFAALANNRLTKLRPANLAAYMRATKAPSELSLRGAYERRNPQSPSQLRPLSLAAAAPARLRARRPSCAWAAGAGLRHGRAAAGRRVVAEVARRLLAGDQLLDLFAGQRLVFEQPLGQRDPFLLLLGQDRAWRSNRPRRSAGAPRRR